MLGRLAGPVVHGGVGQADPAALLGHVSLVADAGRLLSGVAVSPSRRACHRRAGLEGAGADEVIKIELQGGLNRGSSTGVAAACAAHVVS